MIALGVLLIASNLDEVASYYRGHGIRALSLDRLRPVYTAFILGSYFLGTALRVPAEQPETKRESEEVSSLLSTQNLLSHPWSVGLTEISASLTTLFSSLSLWFLRSDIHWVDFIEHFVLYTILLYVAHLTLELGKKDFSQRRKDFALLTGLVYFQFFFFGPIILPLLFPHAIGFSLLTVAVCAMVGVPFAMVMYLFLKPSSFSKLMDSVFVVSMTFMAPAASAFLALAAFGTNF